MERLARLNRTQAFLTTLGVALVGLLAPGWYGAVVLLALVGGLLLLLLHTAAATRPGAVAIRLAVLAGFVLVAMFKVA